MIMLTREIPKQHRRSFIDPLLRSLPVKLIQIEIEHLIRSPRRVFVSVGDDGLNSLEVRAVDGSGQIVNFTEPFVLPAADKR